MKPIYLNNWADGGFAKMCEDFNVALDPKLVKVVLASYGDQDYGGDAFVLFMQDGKLFEVNGSHCSCFGLEAQNYYGSGGTQWEPEETTVESLLHRLEEGELGNNYNGNVYANELRDALKKLKNKL